MGLHDAIHARRTIRDFAGREVSQEIIDRALNAGLRAPSHNHQKGWHFVLLKEREAKLAYIRAEGCGETVTESTLKNISIYEPLAQEMYLDAIPKQNKMILDAPAVLVMAFKPGPRLHHSQNVADMNSLAAAWCCIENILLSLAEDGVSGATLVPHNTPAIKDALGIPRDLEVAAIIPFGYKAPGARIIAQKEVALEDRVHIDRW